MEKEKKELGMRLKAQDKKQDHIERANRIEDIPLLELQKVTNYRYSREGADSMLARCGPHIGIVIILGVFIVNHFGHCMYKFVTPQEKVTDYRYSIGIQMSLSMIN